MLLYTTLTVRLAFLYKVIYLFAALLVWQIQEKDPKFQVCVYQNLMSTYCLCRFIGEKNRVILNYRSARFYLQGIHVFHVFPYTRTHTYLKYLVNSFSVYQKYIFSQPTEM